MTVNALAAAGDVLIAAVLVFMLHRSRTGFRRYVHILLHAILNDLMSDCLNLFDSCRSDSMIRKLVSSRKQLIPAWYS